MKQDLDISNIESKPTDSNPFQKGDAVRLKQSDGCYPKGTMFIVDGLIGNSMVIVFRGAHGVMASVDKYEKTTASAKTLRKIRKRLVSIDETCSVNIKPKRPYPNRVVKSKYDAVVFDLKMAQTALDNRNKEINGWVKQNNELRAEIEKDRQLYRDVLNERDKYKESAEINGKAAHDMLRDYEKVLLDIGKVTAERDRLRAENDELKHKASELNKAYSAANEALYYASENWNACAKSLQVLKREMEEEKIAAFELKAAEHANLDTLARKLRDQRDTALFLAALFFLASAGFAVAVLIGRLIPVY